MRLHISNGANFATLVRHRPLLFLLYIILYGKKRFSYQVYKEILDIIKTSYSCEYAQQIQTRIMNQKHNLLTALLYENVPLTNNLAERSIRPLVVIRKISGGSKQPQGAKVLEVNMSILQTIRMKKLPVFSTLKQYLLESFTGKE